MLTIPTQDNVKEIQLTEPCEPYFGTPIGDTPKQTADILQFDEDKGLISGIWECEKGKLELDLPFDEFCHIIAGHWLITAENGDVTEVKPGDSFFFPKGWKGTCEIKETVRKVFSALL